MAIEGPHESVVGQPTPYHFRVTNEGTGPAMGVAVDVALGRGARSRQRIENHAMRSARSDPANRVTCR